MMLDQKVGTKRVIDETPQGSPIAEVIEGSSSAPPHDFQQVHSDVPPQSQKPDLNQNDWRRISLVLRVQIEERVPHALRHGS